MTRTPFLPPLDYNSREPRLHQPWTNRLKDIRLSLPAALTISMVFAAGTMLACWVALVSAA